jgi:hypothetical protein
MDRFDVTSMRAGERKCVALKRCPRETISSQGRTIEEGHMKVSDIFSRGGNCGGGSRHGGDRGHRGDWGYGGGYYNGGRRYRWSDSGYGRGDGGGEGRRGERDHEELLEVLGIGIL